MLPVTKRRRVKRATIVAKRSQLSKSNLRLSRSYKPLCQKLRANNNVLAKALSKEKQERQAESQYLLAEKMGLSNEVQELRIACNKRDDVISGALKNAKETLQLLITMSNCVTNTISSCQQIVTVSRPTLRKSGINDRRDSSARRLSGKSPARGVVQPMVSGHTITKPTINLSRLTIQREYRVQNPPNLSDIEEDITPQASPQVPTGPTPVRIPITRPLNCGPTRINRLPERLQGSMRVSDESERRSSIGSNRNSARHSARRSRENSLRRSKSSASRRQSRDVPDTEIGGYLRSPRVKLHDVSPLLHNSQSVNIRTLLESSSDMDITIAQNQSEPLAETSMQISDTSTEVVANAVIPETSEDTETDPNVTKSDADNSISPSHERKSRNATLNRTEDDPLEGPSWLFDSTAGTSPSPENKISTTMNNSSPVLNAKEKSRANRTCESDESPRSADYNGGHTFVNSRPRKSKPSQANNPINNANSNDDDHDDDDDDDDDRTTNLATRWRKPPAKFFQNLMNEADSEATSRLSRFVTQSRGSTCDDDDFTLMLNPRLRAKISHNDINDFQLPVLDSPIVTSARPVAPEPEQTTNILRIPTQNFAHFTPDRPRLTVNETLFNHTGLMLPLIEERHNSARASNVVEHESNDEDNRIDKKKRNKRPLRDIAEAVDSPSDSESGPSPNLHSARASAIVEQESDDEDRRIEKKKRNKKPLRNIAKAVDSASDAEGGPSTKSHSARASAIVEQESDDEGHRIEKKKLTKRPLRNVAKTIDSPSDSESGPSTKLHSARAVPIVERESDDDCTTNDKRKRKRPYKKHARCSDSPSDTEWAPTPKRKNVKQKRKAPISKDPSSAKVVLQKLNDARVTKTSTSPDPRVVLDPDIRTKSTAMPHDASSDSDGSSTASAANKPKSARPRRQKAPINLQEPNLSKKMRRN